MKFEGGLAVVIRRSDFRVHSARPVNFAPGVLEKIVPVPPVFSSRVEGLSLPASRAEKVMGEISRAGSQNTDIHRHRGKFALEFLKGGCRSGIVKLENFRLIEFADVLQGRLLRRNAQNLLHAPSVPGAALLKNVDPRYRGRQKNQNTGKNQNALECFHLILSLK